MKTSLALKADWAWVGTGPVNETRTNRTRTRPVTETALDSRTGVPPPTNRFGRNPTKLVANKHCKAPTGPSVMKMKMSSTSVKTSNRIGWQQRQTKSQGRRHVLLFIKATTGNVRWVTIGQQSISQHPKWDFSSS